jgi:3'(2'), 5'-bisphosphate nucleotidase
MAQDPSISSPQTPPEDYAALLPSLLAVCAEAGAAIRHHYESAVAGEFARKSDDSPLTAADLAAHDIIKRGLGQFGAPWPVLSEESSGATRAQRHDWSCFWLVDPLDGTREFLKRSGQFTINIALIDAQRPVLGLVHVPLTGASYFGVPGWGAWRILGDERSRLRTRSLPLAPDLVWLGGPSHTGSTLSRCVAWLREQRSSVRRVNAGSALKFCRLAEGNGDLYPRFWPCCEWDTAAGQALLEAAGGAVIDLGGSPLRYNASASLHSPHFLAIADPGDALWQRLQAELHTWYGSTAG